MRKKDSLLSVSDIMAHKKKTKVTITDNRIEIETEAQKDSSVDEAKQDNEQKVGD